MPEFVRLWEDGPLFAQSEHFKLGTDSVLLADFVNTSRARSGIDLGCGSGIISLLLLARSDKLRMTGLEISPDAAGLAEKNMTANCFDARAEIITGDIRRHRELFRTGAFDLVVANPPYFPQNSGMLSPESGRAAARGEVECTLEEICRASMFLLKTGGSFCVVHRSERLSELMRLMSEYKIEPKRLRLVQHKISSAPSLALVEGRRGGNAGLKIEPPLILADENGMETAEYKRIYHR